MQLYKTIATFAEDDSTTVSFQGSQTEASKKRTALKAEGFVKPTSQTIEVPTSKAGLLVWLNANVTS